MKIEYNSNDYCCIRCKSSDKRESEMITKVCKFCGESYKTKYTLVYNMSTNQHITDQLLRQQGADRLIGTSFGKGTNNRDILLSNGFSGVADCGQKVYVWNQVD